ncbi:PREDICTED: ectonucleoside triphosphate diphosphohydrolase 2 [Buceros rhinoceros silvestris]|uniref:ectonucleoside triphosphate diphosphohydrolase 2 n=1 Tax=Buceros rhinoceros silvestris TaxID=175836 RepID=UPI0005295911|nr:PREDICTED: ectonucleoside triphosphate diphosphohydrolase 2 [Buceros rhinoceros silvestris]
MAWGSRRGYPAPGPDPPPPSLQYGIVLDAGSSHTAVFQCCFLSAGPGISSYSSNPPAAGTSLVPCLNQALGDVPKEKQAGTPLYLANYLLENFIKRGWLGEWIQPQKKTLGAMDFGGASTQITFETRDTIEDPRNEVMLKLYGQAYKVYTHSFLCYGRDQVLKRLLSKLLQVESLQAPISHPCWPTGYQKNLLLSSVYDSPCTEKEKPNLALNTTVTVVGTGNGTLCTLHVSKLFDFSTCSFSRCSFDGIFQPEVSGKFIAFSAFFYTVDFIQTLMGKPVHLPSDLKDAAETICATSWSELLRKAPALEKRLPDYCAVSTFVYLLTTKGYNFNSHSFPNIAFQKKAGETSIGWALGYMLNLTNMIPAEKPSSHKSMLYNYWVILILLFVVTTLTSLATAVCLLRRNKSLAI